MTRVLLVLLAASACASPSEKATDAAAERVRANANQAREVLLGLASAPAAPHGQALLDQARENLSASPDVITFFEQIRPDGGIVVRAAFHARGEAGGGLSYEAVGARLCVELTAAPGPPPSADIRDTDCAATLPRATGNAGNIDTTVTLRG